VCPLNEAAVHSACACRLLAFLCMEWPFPLWRGSANVLHMVGASREPSGRKVLWHNMREEPVSDVHHGFLHRGPVRATLKAASSCKTG